jgi:hypothetical protein
LARFAFRRFRRSRGKGGRALSKDFIDEASECYLHALEHSEPELATLAGLFAKISRIRALSSPAVANEADAHYAGMAPFGLLPTKHARPGKRRIDGPQLRGLIANDSQILALAEGISPLSVMKVSLKSICNRVPDHINM